MRFPVRVFFRLLFLIVAFFLVLAVSPVKTYAQTTQSNEPITNYAPNVESNVPKNQHVLAQSIFIEVLSAVQCLLVGVDPTNPSQPCLDINPTTGKLGYRDTQPLAERENQVGGLVGASASMIGTLYTPSTSTSEYIGYLKDNFGIVKTAHAANNVDGFHGLLPILPLWTVSRNIAYFLLIIAFLFIGLGVMLRVKIDPRTVMTIQNQIPRVIIAILLITFSYPLAAFMIDVMWTVTYMGVNEISSASGNATIPCTTGNLTVAQEATQGIYQTPLAYVNALFKNDCNDIGINALTIKVSNSLGSLIANLITDLFVTPGSGSCVDWTGVHLDNCINRSVALVIGYITRIMLYVIIFIAILISLFRVWFELLKAYVYTLIYVVTAPIWIVFGLAPGRPLGFEKWIRGYFVNLSFFTVIAWLYVGARVITDVFKDNPKDKFVPPLVGNPAIADFSSLMAFGMLMLAPTVLSLLRDKMKVPPIKQGAAVGAGLAAGASVAGAPAAKSWKHLTRRNPTTGMAEGPISRLGDTLGKKALTAMSGRIPGAKGALERKQYKEEHGSLLGYKPGTTNRAMQAKGYENDKTGRKQYAIDQKIKDLETKRDATPFQWRKDRITRQIGELTKEKAGLDQAAAAKKQQQNPGGTPTPPVTPPSVTTGAPAAGTTGTPAGGAANLTTPPPTQNLVVSIEYPGGSQEVDFAGKSESTKKVVLDSLQNVTDSPEKQQLIEYIERESGATGDIDRSGHWNRAAGSLPSDQVAKVQETIDRYLKQPGATAPQGNAEEPEEPEEPEESQTS